MHLLLDIRILDGPFLFVFYGVSLLVLGYLLARRPTRSWLLTSAIAIISGVGVGLLAGWLVSGLWDIFGVSFTPITRMWIALALGGIAVAIVNLWRSRWWRKTIAALAIVLFAVTCAVGLNVDFGMYTTIRSALGLENFPVVKPPALDSPTEPVPPAVVEPLWKTWVPPATMPVKGEVGTVTIPATVSGFAARDALVYLPPAALTSDPPKLPVLIMLSGQPGAPYNIFDSLKLATVLDSYSAAHKGLAPIVVVPDQLGAPDRNPMCVDSKLGNSATYLTVDVREWILKHLNVEQDRLDWAVGGYSQGGTCSIQLAAGYPQIFGSFVDVSGELTPHVGSEQNTIDQGFGGSAEAYASAKPLAILAAHTPYLDSTAIFGIGQDDKRFTPGQRTLADASEKAGMKVTFIISPGSAHDWHTVRYTLERAMPILYMRWGLSG